MKSLLSLPALPKPGQRLDLPPLAASADALALTQLARPGTLLAVVTASPLEAQRLAEEIAWFAPDLRVHLLPDWETLPYDNFSPHQDLISERLDTLYGLQKGACDVVVLAGKGHEDYQDVAGVKRPFLDADVAQRALQQRHGQPQGAAA